MRLLVVESNPDIRFQLMRYLREAFPQSEVRPYDPATDGDPEADFNWSKFDVLLLSYQLDTQRTGLDWLRKYKRESARFPATILLTEGEDEDVAVRALRYGAHDFLRKQGLNAIKLAETVADALNVRYRESNAESSLSISASKFSKSFFYGQLDMAFEEARENKTRALLLIRADGYDALSKSLGVLAMEDVTRYLANVGIELFRFSKYRPRATRFSDASIGILVGGHKDTQELAAAMSDFCRRISDQPPTLDELKVPVSVSIGAVIINSPSLTVYDVFERAENAALEAAQSEGSTYLITVPGFSRGGKAREPDTAPEIDAESAFRDNRIQSMFEPITSVSERNMQFDTTDFFEIQPYFISPQGALESADSVLANGAGESIVKLVDRWKVRECVSRLCSPSLPENRTPAFLINFTDISLMDEKLPHWVDQLMKHHAGEKIGGKIIIDVSSNALMRFAKRVVPVCKELQDKHGFRFALKDILDSATCKVCFAQLNFDLIIISHKCTELFLKERRTNNDCGQLLEFAARQDVRTLARDIENANALGAVISAGVDFVHGDFIAPAQEEIEASIGIETVQLGDSTASC